MMEVGFKHQWLVVKRNVSWCLVYYTACTTWDHVLAMRDHLTQVQIAGDDQYLPSHVKSCKSQSSHPAIAVSPMWLNQELSIFLIFWLSGPLTFLAGPSKSLSMYVVLSVWYEFACQKSKLIRHSSFVVIVHDVQNSKSSHDSIYKTDIDTRLLKQVCRNADRTFLWAVERAFIRAPERLRLNWLAPFLCVPSSFNHLDHIFYALWDIIDFNPIILLVGWCLHECTCMSDPKIL